MNKNLSSKYSQKLLDTVKISTKDAIKTASKRAIQKIAGATGDLISNKITDKITISSKKFFKELHSTELHSEKEEVNNEIARERHVSTEKRQQIIDELKLI